MHARFGPPHSYNRENKLLKCEPIDLSCYVVDLRDRHLDYWTPYSDMHASTRAQQQTLYLPLMVRPPYHEGPGHTFTIHPS